jgi:phosphohistidine swiveling domain-containing protein
MRCHTAGRASAIATAARGPSLYAIAGRPFYVVEVEVFNTTDTEFVAALQRASATGTQGAGLTEVCEDVDYTPVTTGFNTHTADATITAGEFARATLGAAKGAGVIWTFGKNGLKIDPGTTSGIVITCPTGTGQIFDFTYIWDE